MRDPPSQVWTVDLMLTPVTFAEFTRLGAIGMPLTFSAGTGIWPEDATNLGDLFDIVDKRLYSAKRSGRNRTVGPLKSRYAAQSVHSTVVPLVGVG
jgi:hypothetical protein